MSQGKLLIIGVGLAMVGAFASPASAQDGPAITVDPTSVDEAGEATFTVTGTGFTLPALFVLPCDFPEGGDVANLDTDSCDVANLTPVAPDDDGNFEAEVTYDVPAEGIAIAATDAGQIESGVVAISVGAAEEEPAEGGDDEDADAAGEELPATGAESVGLAILGLTLAAAGALVVNGGRRLNRI